MMQRHAFAMLACATANLWLTPLAAQETTPVNAPAEKTPLEIRAEQIVALINGKGEPADIFSARFLAAVPEAQLKALGESFTARVGAAVAVSVLEPRSGTRARLEIRFERGIAKGSIGIDPGEENRVSELLFTAVDPTAAADDTADKIAADLAALPGAVGASFAPLAGGTPVVSINADKPLALGSAFKLYVLAALAEDVKTGKRKWSDVVPLTQKSYPSGQLQVWPKGAPLTLHTLASLMISISDNTATDQLIAALGKDRILKLMKDSGHADPARNTPFLTTRELFVIKASDAQRIAGWRNSDMARRAMILKEIDSENPTLEQIAAAFANGPKALDIEWFASPADLARLFAHMRRTADPGAFDILAISPSANGETIKAKWDYIGFKGGSEPGVLDFIWLLTDKAGRDWVLTLQWNNEAAALDNSRLEALAQRILLLPR